MKLVNSFIKIFKKAEDIALIVLLSLLVVISVSQLFLNMFNAGVIWFDSLLKYLVLWIGMIAASIATYDDKHIKIDLIGRFTKGRIRTFVTIITNIFAGIVCVVLFVISIDYIVKIEYTSSDPSPFLGFRRWALIIAMPFGFGLMSIKFIILGIRSIYYFIINKDISSSIEEVEKVTSIEIKSEDI